MTSANSTRRDDKPPSGAARAAQRYIDAGFAPIPIPAGSKNPNRRGWQNERLTAEDLPHCWTNGQNIGILNGEPSRWRVTIDLDVPEALSIATRFLPHTLTSGRESTPHSHWWYKAVGAETEKWKDTDGTVLLELRSTGCQTVVEPSTHPEGDRYQWHRGPEIAEVDPTELRDASKELATAVLIARHLPPVGGRHDFALALIGFLLRRLDEETVGRMVHAAWDAAGGANREAHRDLEGIIHDTRQKLDVGEKVAGGTTLGEVADGVPRLLSKWWGWQQKPESEPFTPLSSYELTDLGNVDRFLCQHGHRVRWCSALKSFLVYDGKRWAKDDRGEVVKLAQQTARSIHKEAADAAAKDEQRQIASWALTSQNATRINAMLSQAQPHLAVGMDELDADPWLFNCASCTIDLRTGTPRSHNPSDLITKLSPVAYEPKAKAPRFIRFLRETLVDGDVISFVQRFAGYSLTGDTRERLLAVLWGTGKNGKSTLVELLRDVLGDYATNTDVETILSRRYAGVGNDIAALKGARLVSCAEVEQGRRLAESKVKALTGQDTVTARFLFCEPFDYKPAFKLWLSTNNKPEIQGTDDAIWDRLRLIPFTQRFDGVCQDKRLSEKLRTELPGVLAWMVEGCLDWQREGLGEPKRVAAATEAYRTEMDVLASFFEDRCVVSKSAWAPATPLYEAYKSWCAENGEPEEKQRRFGARLSERGFTSFTITSGTYKGRKGWRGIGLRVDDPDPVGGGERSDDGPSEEREGLPGRPSDKNSLPDELALSMGNSDQYGRPSRPSRQKNQNPRGDVASRKEPFEKRSTSSTSSTLPTGGGPRRRLTEEEAREVQKLITQGMEPSIARAEVLGEWGL